MTAHVALLRGINVGGKNSLPMQDLRDILGSLGCENVKTYIQSGNAVFHAADNTKTLVNNIRNAIEQRFGFAPTVLLLSADKFKAIAAANPYPQAEETPKLLHVWFLAEAPTSPDLDALASVKAPSEKFALLGDAFYLHAPDGIGRSRLAAKVDRCLGVATTARNWRTVTKLLALADTNIG